LRRCFISDVFTCCNRQNKTK